MKWRTKLAGRIVAATMTVICGTAIAICDAAPASAAGRSLYSFQQNIDGYHDGSSWNPDAEPDTAAYIEQIPSPPLTLSMVEVCSSQFNSFVTALGPLGYRFAGWEEDNPYKTDSRCTWDGNLVAVVGSASGAPQPLGWAFATQDEGSRARGAVCEGANVLYYVYAACASHFSIHHADGTNTAQAGDYFDGATYIYGQYTSLIVLQCDCNIQITSTSNQWTDSQDAAQYTTGYNEANKSGTCAVTCFKVTIPSSNVMSDYSFFSTAYTHNPPAVTKDLGNSDHYAYDGFIS